MPRRRSLSSQLYRAARIANDVEAVESGNPKRVVRRAKNVTLGRALGRAGVWRRLWRSSLILRLPRALFQVGLGDQERPGRRIGWSLGRSAVSRGLPT